MTPDWDIHPEMITHTRVIDLQTGRPLPQRADGGYWMENGGWDNGRSLDEITSYIAYALQIHALPDSARAVLLAETHIDMPVQRTALNEKTLMFTPTEFAVSAWQHFQAEGHGCDFVQSILRGEVNFQSHSP